MLGKRMMSGACWARLLGKTFGQDFWARLYSSALSSHLIPMNRDTPSPPACWRLARLVLVAFLAVIGHIAGMTPGGVGQNGHAMASEPLTFSMTPDMAAHWQLVTDGVMGGVSRGALRFETDQDGTGFARMTGTVSTANNGGFIQFRAGVDFARLVDRGVDPTGLRLRVRGNGETYYVHLRTRANRRPWHYYAATFPTSADWQQVDLPFSRFRHTAGLTDTPPEVRDIISIGIVAYGRDHAADLSVADMTIY